MTSEAMVVSPVAEDEHAGDGPASPPGPPADDAGIPLEAVQLPRPESIPDASSIAPPSISTDRTTVTLVRGAKGQWGFVDGTRLINNISPIVGFMELANAGDFAANVWNVIPVPVYAMVLMAVGATVAGVLSVCAFRDAREAYKNVRFLRQQWRDQKVERAGRLERRESTVDIDVYLAITFRELGSEIMARWLLDIFMGFGGVLICIGTYMAIGGADRKVFLASNILSGYLGNAPIALYGLANTCWASYIFCKAQGHINATRKPLSGSKAVAHVKRRSRHVQVFCLINGTATTLGGVGSMLTATRWWGYVILIPVIISSVFCNIWWRKRVGYSRLSVSPSECPALEPSDLVARLEFAARAEIKLREHRASPIAQFVSDPQSLPEVLAWLQEHDLLDNFCLELASTEQIYEELAGDHPAELNICLDEVLALPEPFHDTLLEKAQNCVRVLGPKHFMNRERYLAELVGTHYSITGNRGNNRIKTEK